ncbi:MAG: hypothetical protein HDT38_01115 [Clostridiales bacterium]|nr:hypothetical protein [Clostridiales bacterium]
MNSLEALREFQTVVRQDQYTINYCGRELNWIRNRAQDWASDRIRVGVIGVTSSGKSTLINAILGEDILSSAVAPSSGQLVCCSYGEAPEIIIRFENGSKKKLSGTQFSREKLMQFSDERYNPQNKKGVLSIELTSPQFDLGKDVLLVDSPGLDAFGLESHEKLTLESLVPTIDACIYVTTMKTNSDRKTKEILNTVARYRCPIIIVQNMLDAVRPSPSGDKTSEQVALDHRKRVQRIVDESDIVDKGSAQIIQISAEYAKQWRACPAQKDKNNVRQVHYIQSNYETFVKSVSDILETQRPRIEQQRLLGIIGQMHNVADSLKEKIDKPAGRAETSFPLQLLKTQTNKNKKKFAERYQKIMKDYITASKQICVAIGVETDCRSRTIMLPDLEAGLRNANEAVKQFETQLSNLISEYNQFVIEAAGKLNIPSRDLLCSSALHSFREINLEKKTETEQVRVKKSGIGNGIARFFGSLFDTDWGYEYESREKVVTDVETTKKKICDRLKDAYNRYNLTMQDWSKKSFSRSIELIQKEISAEEESYHKRQEAVVEVESFSKLYQALTRLMQKIEKDMPNPKYDVNAIERTPVLTSKKIEVNSYVGSVLGISREALRIQHWEIARKFIQAVGCSRHRPVVISWDEGSKNEFLHQTGIKDAQIIFTPTGQLFFPTREKRCVFVLVNTVQFGSALKQIAALKLSDCLNKSDFVVWVVQDFQELMVGSRTSEGLTQMGELTLQVPVPCRSMIYIIHENPLYNLAFLKYQMDPLLRRTPERLIYEIQNTYQVYTSEELESLLGTMLRSVYLRNLDR